jgi:UDP-N-acetyl-D-glucosamine dehydrogenase
MKSQDLTPQFLSTLDAVLIATDHSGFDYDSIVKHAPLVIDTRNATACVTDNREKIRKT